MSSTVVPFEERHGSALPPPAELARANESLQRRESLLSAAAKASHLLLEAPDPLQAMPEVLRLLGEAAEVDRTALALAEVGPNGERWLVIKSEWVADGIVGQGCEPNRMAWNERKSDCFCTELQAGRSVFVCRERSPGTDGTSIASEGARSSVIVPILIDSEYAGAIGFDDCRQPRQFDPAMVSTLEIAAGLIGAALHRERLVETMRRERERAVEDRVYELARANAAIRANLEHLATEPDLRLFGNHLLLQATRELGAVSGSIVVNREGEAEWRVIAFVESGRIIDPPFAPAVPRSQADFARLQSLGREPDHLLLDEVDSLPWPGALEYHRRQGHRALYGLPLVFGEHIIGLIVLALPHRDPLGSVRKEVLVALGQQATLAIGMKRLAESARTAAVLAERNRIAQEIHDGLAQAFTGILMQLGAAEEHMGCARRSPLPEIIGRIRDLAREGLSEARRSVLALRPDAPRAGGLECALRQLAERATIAGRVTCAFEGGGTLSGLPPEHQHELLRIAQEAVSNAVRHASPKHVRIALAEEPAQWVLSVTDDGRGMGRLPKLLEQQGFGLANMRERAAAIGGHCEIESRAGAGTRVTVRLPRTRSA